MAKWSNDAAGVYRWLTQNYCIIFCLYWSPVMWTEENHWTSFPVPALAISSVYWRPRATWVVVFGSCCVLLPRGLRAVFYPGWNAPHKGVFLRCSRWTGPLFSISFSLFVSTACCVCFHAGWKPAFLRQHRVLRRPVGRSGAGQTGGKERRLRSGGAVFHLSTQTWWVLPLTHPLS